MATKSPNHKSKIKFSAYIVEEAAQMFLNKGRNQFKGTDKAFEKKFKPQLRKFLKELTQELRAAIAKGCINEIEHSRKHHNKVMRKIRNIHKGSIQLFDFLLQLNASIARTCYLRYHKIFVSQADHLKLETLIEIHSRACQIAEEINLLVKNGYADGALARWRSLHELCTTFLFLYDNDSSVVEMYNDYAIIEEHKKIKRYEEAHPKLNWKPISQQEIDYLTQEKDRLIAKYGKEFSKEYGWTLKAIAPGERHFKGLEKAVEKDSLRGIYSWASENIHAGVLGNKNRLGIPAGKENYLLTGASEYGLFDPIQFTTYSLNEMTEVLLGMENTILNNTYQDILWAFHNEMVNYLVEECKNLES